jgi:1-deoxy-D-xylulose-5-phosphate reductoisomerase
MRVPIAYGLAFPERIASGATALDFATLGNLTFEGADRERFPGLHLAWDALAGAEGSAAVLNAANEEAVAAFLDGRLRFPDIHAVNAAALDGVAPNLPLQPTLDDLVDLDTRARAHARGLLKARAR